MQRLGFLKVTARLASKSRAQSLESLTRSFASVVTQRVPVSEERAAAFHSYVRQQQIRRYQGESTSAEVQDIWLSDEALPSRSGAITGDLDRAGYRHAVFVDIPTWAAKLQLVREKNYTLTDRGRTLLLPQMVRPVGSRDESTQNENPLLLGIGERYNFLFCLLEADGDLLQGMYRQLLNRESFSRAEAGEAAADCLDEIRTTRLRSVSAGPSQQVRSRIDRALSAIRKQAGPGLGPRESIATPRTEPLVDCGILRRLRPDIYDYKFTEWGKVFLNHLVASPSLTEFIERYLSKAMTDGTSHTLASGPAPLEAVAGPYLLLRAGLGYVSIRELAVASNAAALSSGAALHELAAIDESLKRAAAEKGREVRLAHGRSGGVAQVRIDPRLFPKA